MIADNYKAISSYLSKKLVVIINDQIKNHGMFGWKFKNFSNLKIIYFNSGFRVEVET